MTCGKYLFANLLPETTEAQVCAQIFGFSSSIITFPFTNSNHKAPHSCERRNRSLAHHPLDSPPDRRAQGRTSYIFAPLKPLPSSPLLSPLFLSSTRIHPTEAEVIRKSHHFILATSNLPKHEVNTISSPIHRARQVFAPSRHCRSILPSSRSHPSPSDSSYSHPLSLHNSHPTFFTIPIPLSHHSQPPPTARTSTDT